MAKEIFNVAVKLENIVCHREGDGWGSSEAYLWSIFFKIDGFSVVQNLNRLEGGASFEFGIGSHGNLPNHDIDPGDVVQIPPAIGEWSSLVTPIELTDLSGNVVATMPPIIGVVAVLMEENSVTDSGAEAGHQALNNFVRNSINNFIAGIDLLDFLNVENPLEILQGQIDALIAQIKNSVNGIVEDAVTSEQAWYEDLLAFFDPDHKIGDVVWTFSLDEIKAQGNNIQLFEELKRFITIPPNPPFSHQPTTVLNQHFDLNGEITATEVCPAKAVNTVVAVDLELLHRFRDRVSKSDPKFLNWAALASKNAPYLVSELKRDPQLREHTGKALRLVEAHIASNKPFDKEAIATFEEIGKCLAKSKHSSLRKEAKKFQKLFAQFHGKPIPELVTFLADFKRE